jgi:release factor glutamine methyltransferase
MRIRRQPAALNEIAAAAKLIFHFAKYTNMVAQLICEEVYQPAEDTYLLLKAALNESKPTDEAIELGCGRCLIAAALAQRVKTLIATDINPHAVMLAKSKGLDTVRADIFRGIRAKFDLVIFNPPYLPTSDEEKIEGWLNRAFDGGPSGRDIVFRFLENLRDYLKEDGRALLLISSLTGLEEVKKKAGEVELDSCVVCHERYFFEHLYVLRLRTSKPGFTS